MATCLLYLYGWLTILAAVHNYIDVKAVALYATTHGLLVLLSVSIEDINQYYGPTMDGEVGLLPCFVVSIR